MKTKFGLLLISSLLLSCNSKKEDILTVDKLSQVKIQTLGQEEKAIWDYYQDIERQILRDKRATRDQAIDFVQSLIDKGLIHEPTIHIETEKGTETKIVDYRTYKAFREQIPIDTNRHYIVSFKSQYEQDSIYADSIRTIILNELEADSVCVKND